MQDQGVTGLFVGRSTLDIVYACDRLPEPDGKVDARAGYVAGGGPALNAAIAFAALGGQARLASPVGAGPMADAARADVLGHGVELIDAAAGQEGVLPVSSVVLTGAARAIVNQPLPRAVAPAPEVLERLFASRPGIVLSDGHLAELALPVLRGARARAIPTVLDGGSWKPWTAELLPLIDIAIVSGRFVPPGAGQGPAPAIAHLRRTIAAVAVTGGSGPILWSAGGASGEIVPPTVEAIDTLGAGDIFHGAFCHAFALSRDFPAALAAAAKVAALSCASLGPRAWIAELRKP
jgi:sugar/nucleoside kinase (ribokinase family)